MPRQSARFGVKSTSIVTSSNCKYSRISWPTGASAGSSTIPSWSSEIPNSEKLHNMPNEGCPRNFAFLILKLPGNTAPTLATATLSPWRQFGAPQTISINSSSPTLIFVTRSLSASGCWPHSTTSPTTTPLNSPATGSTPSTSRPAIVIWSASCSLEISGFTHSLSHFSLNFILSRPYLNCFRKRRSFSKNARKSFTP